MNDNFNHDFIHVLPSNELPPNREPPMLQPFPDTDQRLEALKHNIQTPPSSCNSEPVAQDLEQCHFQIHADLSFCEQDRFLCDLEPRGLDGKSLACRASALCSFDSTRTLSCDWTTIEALSGPSEFRNLLETRSITGKLLSRFKRLELPKAPLNATEQMLLVTISGLLGRAHSIRISPDLPLHVDKYDASDLTGLLGRLTCIFQRKGPVLTIGSFAPPNLEVITVQLLFQWSVALAEMSIVDRLVAPPPPGFTNGPGPIPPVNGAPNGRPPPVNGAPGGRPPPVNGAPSGRPPPVNGAQGGRPPPGCPPNVGGPPNNGPPAGRPPNTRPPSARPPPAGQKVPPHVRYYSKYSDSDSSGYSDTSDYDSGPTYRRYQPSLPSRESNLRRKIERLTKRGEQIQQRKETLGLKLKGVISKIDDVDEFVDKLSDADHGALLGGILEWYRFVGGCLVAILAFLLFIAKFSG